MVHLVVGGGLVSGWPISEQTAGPGVADHTTSLDHLPRRGSDGQAQTERTRASALGVFALARPAAA